MLRHFGHRRIDLTLEASALLLSFSTAFVTGEFFDLGLPFLSELFNLLATPSIN